MKNLFILGMVLLSANSFAGNEKGNGGGIHYCQDNKTQEFYDIYEAQARYGYTLKENNLSVDAQINAAIDKIKKSNPYIGREFEKQINYLKKGHVISRSKVRLTPIGDAKILIVDEGCSYQQLANWDEVSGNVIVNKDYFDRMDNLNKAALYAHEALYKVGRSLLLLPRQEDGTTNSDTIRRMVGEIFSVNDSLEQMWSVVDPQIEIDRQKAIKDAMKKKMNNLLLVCQQASDQVDEYVSQMDTSNSEEYIPKYLTFHSNKYNICIDSDVTLESDMREALNYSTQVWIYEYQVKVKKIKDDMMKKHLSMVASIVKEKK